MIITCKQQLQLITHLFINYIFLLKSLELNNGLLFVKQIIYFLIIFPFIQHKKNLLRLYYNFLDQLHIYFLNKYFCEQFFINLIKQQYVVIIKLYLKLLLPKNLINVQKFSKDFNLKNRYKQFKTLYCSNINLKLLKLFKLKFIYLLKYYLSTIFIDFLKIFLFFW